MSNCYLKSPSVIKDERTEYDKMMNALYSIGPSQKKDIRENYTYCRDCTSLYPQYGTCNNIFNRKR